MRANFVHRRPKNMPRLKLHMRVMVDIHKAFHCPISDSNLGATITAIADTGAQTCISGQEIAEDIGLCTEYRHRVPSTVLPCRQYMSTVFSMLRYSRAAEKRDNKCAFADNISGLFLFVRARIELSVILASFTNTPLSTISTLDNSCNCPICETPPARPTKIPFPSTTYNTEKLEAWILQRCAGNTLNNCLHQQLPNISSKPTGDSLPSRCKTSCAS